MNRLLIALGLLGLGALWATGWDAPFVYDDKIEVVGNPTLRVLTDVSALATYNVSRPLLISSYAVNWLLGGLDPRGYHALSIAIHLLNVVLLGALASRLTSSRVGWTAALIWGAHPMTIQGVTYITGRSDALCATFWLAAGLCWITRSPRATVLWVLAGLLTKELTVLLPVALWLLRRPEPNERRWIAVVGGLIVAGAALRVGFMGWPTPEIARPAWQQALGQAPVWSSYVRLWMLPFGQSILHDPAPDLLWGALHLGVWGVAMIAAATHLQSPWARGLLIAVCWLFPSGAVPLKEWMAEHRAYLAGAVLIVAAVWLTQRRLWLWAPIAAVLAALTVAQNQVWRSEVRLWQQAADRYPDSADAHYGLADALRFAQRWGEAEAGFRHVLTLRPDDEPATINLGITLAEGGRADEAQTVWQEWTRRNPKSCAAHNNLGALALRRGDRRAATDAYGSALTWCPDDPVALVNLGHLAWDRGDTRTARVWYNRYLRQLPTGAEADRIRARM